MTDLIRAATPLFLALSGVAITLAALFTPELSDAKFAAVMGLAASAVTGAAGLAQSTERQTKVSVDGNKIEAGDRQVE